MKKEHLLWLGGGLLAVGGLVWAVSAAQEAAFEGSDTYEEQEGEDKAAPPPSTATQNASASINPAALWQAASQYQGSAWTYAKGGVGDNNTIDCSGLPFRAARDAGFRVERRASMQAATSTAINEEQAKQTPGALVFFHHPQDDKVYHVEMSTGDGRVFGAQTSRRNPSRPSLTFSRWGGWTSWGAPPLRVSYGLLNAV